MACFAERRRPLLLPLDQLQRLTLSVNGGMRLQDVDYTYTTLGQLSTVNQIEEGSGAPLMITAPGTECIGCEVSASSLTFEPVPPTTAPRAITPKPAGASEAELVVVDLRTGGGESLPLNYPYPADDLPAVWTDLGAVLDSDPVTKGRFRYDPATGKAELISGVPLDYVEFLDRARDIRFRVPFDVYGKDGSCVRCGGDRGAVRNASGEISTKKLLALAQHEAAVDRRSYSGRKRTETRLIALGYAIPTSAPATGVLSASWWRDSLPNAPTHAFHPVQITARFRPSTLLGQEVATGKKPGASQRGKRTPAPAAGEAKDTYAGYLQLRIAYDVVNDTGAARRQYLNRNVALLLTPATAPGLVAGFPYDDRLYEVSIDASDLWTYGSEGLSDDHVPISKLALRLSAKLARALDTAVLDLSGVQVARVAAEGMAPIFEELVAGTVDPEPSLAMAAAAAGAGAGNSPGPGPGPGPGTGSSPNVLADVFALQLKYHLEPHVTSAPLRRGGEITEAVWQSAGRRAQAYGYTYDAYGRLKVAVFADRQASGWVASGRYSSSYIYDADGNVTKLWREGTTQPYNPAAGPPAYGVIDDLTYTYTAVNTGKRLTGLADDSGRGAGRPSGPSALGYSAAGELLTDQARGITVVYDVFSMPRRITTPQGRLELTYDALGRKWRQRAYATNNTLLSQESTYGAVQYRGTTPYAIGHAHGRAKFDNPATRNAWTYEFVLRDHLGSARVVLRDRYFDERDGRYVLGGEPGDPLVYNAVVLQVDDYYPFGMRIDDQASARGQDYEYTYTGKEEVTEIGLNWQDYGARWLDPAIGRWAVVDPLAALMPGASPYSYGFNNPMSFTDPTGMAPESVGADGLTNSQWMQSSRPGADPSLAGQYRADNRTDEIQQARIQSWHSKSLIHNPWAGEEVSRDVVDNRLQIAYSGAVVGINMEAASRLGQLLSSTGTGFGYMSLTTGILAEYHYSKTFNTFLGWNGRHAYTSWAQAANKYAPVIADAKAMRNIIGGASTAFSAVGAASAAYDYSQSSQGAAAKIRLGAELSVAYASNRSPYGIEVGVGWEMGRIATSFGPYRRAMYRHHHLHEFRFFGYEFMR